MNSSKSISNTSVSIPALIGGMIGAAVVTAASTYFMDPVMGKRRRDHVRDRVSELGDQVTHLGRDVADRADDIARQAIEHVHAAQSDVKYSEKDFPEDYPDGQLHS